MSLLREFVFLVEQFLAAFLHPRFASFSAVVETVEDLVPGRFVGTVIAIAKTVMQLVHKIAKMQAE